MYSAAILITIAGVSACVWGSQLPVKIYTTADGLSNNRINKIVRDSRGFLWFCTQEGLSRFDRLHQLRSAARTSSPLCE
jgi:ligand-binding sensor domain-containing protein